MTHSPLVLDEDGNTKPVYEQHPTYYPAKGLDEAGTLIRTRAPVFSCDYVYGFDRQQAGTAAQVIDLKHGLHVFGMRANDEADFPTERHKQYALMHAASWLILEEGRRRPRPADELKALHRYERIITGQEDVPPERDEDASSDDPHSPF